MSQSNAKDNGLITYKLKYPILNFVKGELFDFDPEWNEWIRKRDGERYNYRGSIGEGEVAMLLNYLREAKLTSIMEQVK